MDPERSPGVPQRETNALEEDSHPHLPRQASAASSLFSSRSGGGNDSEAKSLSSAGSGEAPDVAKTPWQPVCCVALLGLSPGFVVSSYLASCGYFQLKFDSSILFGIQALITYGINFMVCLLQEVFDDSVDRIVGATHAWGFRIIACSIVGSVVSLTLPACQSFTVVLVIGAIISFFALAQFTSAMSLAASVIKGGGVVVSLGFTLGSALPYLTTRWVHYAPGCSLARAFTFHAITGGVALVCVSLWTYEHMILAVKSFSRPTRRRDQHGSMDSTGGTEAIDDETGAGHSVTSEFMRTAYDTLSLTRQLSEEKDEGVLMDSWRQLRKYCRQTAVFIVLSNSVGFAVVPLFTIGDPHEAQRLYLSKCLGDVLGRVVAAGHAWKCSSDGHVSIWVRTVAVICFALRITVSVLLILSLLHDCVPHLSHSASVIVSFSAGGYGMIMLDLGEQVEEDFGQMRKQVQRRNMLAQFSGQLIGIGIGLGLHAGI